MPTLFVIIIVAILLYAFKSIYGWKGDTVTVQQFHEVWNEPAKRGEGTHLIDVREPDEFASGRVPGAESIPLSKVVGKAADLKKFTTIYCICHSGARSAAACLALEKQLPESIKVINILGGTSAWRAAGYQVEK